MLKKTLFAGIVLACCATSFADNTPATPAILAVPAVATFAPVPSNCSATYKTYDGVVHQLPSAKESQPFVFSYQSSPTANLDVTCNGSTAKYQFVFSPNNGMTITFIGGNYTAGNALNVNRVSDGVHPPAQCVTPNKGAKFPLDTTGSTVYVNTGSSCTN